MERTPSRRLAAERARQLQARPVPQRRGGVARRAEPGLCRRHPALRPLRGQQQAPPAEQHVRPELPRRRQA
eukprot:15454420-Alexandrium_andersonii.AAC.1